MEEPHRRGARAPNGWRTRPVRARPARPLPAETLPQALAPAGAPSPFAGKTAVSLRVIRPRKLLEGDTLEFDPAAMKANLEYGYQCAKEQWPDSGNLFIPNLFVARSTDAPDPVVRGPVV
ncbi:MAG TPA: hypothetical protein VHG91_20340 [Longimicrobium sp.]|nr:hypothetical protein [Longimicrobium sp.]